jgi:hypothetical protein
LSTHFDAGSLGAYLGGSSEEFSGRNREPFIAQIPERKSINPVIYSFDSQPHFGVKRSNISAVAQIAL